VGPKHPDLPAYIRLRHATAAIKGLYRRTSLRSVSAESANDDVFCRSLAWRSAVAALLRLAGLASIPKADRCSD